MGYCTVEDVQAGAGNLLDDLTANPSQAELEGFIARVGAVLDGYLAGAGQVVPATSPIVVGALADTNIDGALVLALEARFNGQQPPEALVGARARWAAALKQLGAGTHAALVAIDEETGQVAGSRSGSFFSDDADGYVPAALDPNRCANRNTDPMIYEGMLL